MPKAKKILIKKLPKFETDVYAHLSFGDLVVFALSYLEEKEIEVNTEEIVSICFRLFPQKFGLKNYPRWPDSALVTRRVNDVREKKLIKGNASDGFALTFKGKQVAKRAAKLLGIKKKDAPKKKIQKPLSLVLTKKTLRKRFQKPIQSKAGKKKTTKVVTTKPVNKKKVTAKAIITKSVKKVVNQIKKKATKVAATKKRVLPIRATKVTKSDKKKSGELKIRATKVEVKKKVKVKKQVDLKQEVISKENKKVIVKQKPKQLTMALAAPAPVKKKVTENKKQVEVKKEALKVVKVEPVVNTSKEEKIKAGRVIYQVEKSDAYKLYKKNGRQAKISEFDFRNMLFATMESSADTLTRNVALFKKYANIQSRNDVITFLNFCEEFFAKLLKKR